jgi:acyl transferase domain-containing protein
MQDISLGLFFRGNFRTHNCNSGALKSNIGHLEGASGIAGIIKTVLVLEKGIIPPNTNFEKLNPRIRADLLL